MIQGEHRDNLDEKNLVLVSVSLKIFLLFSDASLGLLCPSGSVE